jgi:hypothetical protein
MIAIRRLVFIYAKGAHIFTGSNACMSLTDAIQQNTIAVRSIYEEAFHVMWEQRHNSTTVSHTVACINIKGVSHATWMMYEDSSRF